MGCCFGKEYERLSNEISLADNLMPIIPPEISKLRECNTNQQRQLSKLFEEFAISNSKTLTLTSLTIGFQKIGKTLSTKAGTRMIKQMHLSAAPPNEVEFKGFAMAIISRRSILYDFLYSDFDTKEEKEMEEEEAKKKGLFGSMFKSNS